MRQTLSILLAVGLLHGAAIAQGGVAPMLTIRAEAGCKGAYVRVADVAQIKATEELANRVGSLCLGPVPRQNAERVVKRSEVISVLQEAGDWAGSFVVKGAEQTRVRPAQITIAGSDLAQAVRHAVTERCEQMRNVEAEVEITFIPKPIRVKSSRFELVPELPGDRFLCQRRSIRVSVQQDGRRVASALVGLKVRLMREVAVAAQRIKAGTRLEEAHIRIEKREVRGTIRPPVRLESIIGKQTRFMVREGREIEERFVERVPVIRRGDRVVISVVRGALLIKATAEARSEAGIGETVRLRLVDGGAEVRAVAVGPGHARL